MVEMSQDLMSARERIEKLDFDRTKLINKMNKNVKEKELAVESLTQKNEQITTLIIRVDTYKSENSSLTNKVEALNNEYEILKDNKERQIK